MKKQKNLTEGNINKQLISLTWPMLLGMMGIVIFNLVDTYFVGKLGVQQLAAMSFTFPVVMILNSISLGIGVGTSSLISRHFISANRDEVKLMGNHALVLGFIIVMVVVIAGLMTIQPVFRLLGAGPVVIDYIEQYMRIWYLGVPFVVFPMIGNNILRATGDTFTPGMIMMASGIINGFLDPVFIFGFGPVPAMGIQGAALATVISRGISLVVILYILTRKVQLLSLKLSSIQTMAATWKRIIHIAGPATLTMLVAPVSIGAITRILSGFGEGAVAAFGVASRVEMFAMMVIMALGSVLVIFVGQNLSMNKFARITSALKVSAKFAMVWGGVIYLLLLISGNFIAGLFSVNPHVIEITKGYFVIVASSYGFMGIVFLTTSSFNGLNKPYPATAFSILRMMLLYIPLAWLGARIMGLPGIFWAGFLANIISGIFSLAYFFKTIGKMTATQDTSSVVPQG